MDFPVSSLFHVAVWAKLTLAPLAIQWAKKGISLIPALAPHTALAGSVSAFVIGAGLPIWAGVEANLNPWLIAAQAVIGAVYVNLLYLYGIEPMSKGPNPLIPDA